MADDRDNPYGDPFDEDRRTPEPLPIADPGGYAIAAAAGELKAIRSGATVLKVMSAIAAGLWLLAVISVFWNWWEMSDTGNMGTTLGITTGSLDNERILQALATTLTSTWGYLLVAVLAYAASTALHAQRMRLLVDAAAAEGE